MAIDPGTGDPNAKVTDPTGGEPNFNIQQIFNQFGYYPTQAEINAIAPSFGGTYDVLETGTSAVSQYVLHKQAEAERQKNDPLAALQTRIEESVALMKNQVQGLQGQLQDTLSAAPQLFGSLAPDQIQSYLAPLTTAFNTQLSAVQGVLASRNLGGSSIEANALAQTGQQFKENVLSTGLNIGLTSQQAKAKAIQDQINNMFGLTGQEEQIGAAAAGQRSGQNLGQSNLIASLPFFLNQASRQQDLIQRQLRSGGGFMDTFNKVTSGINQGVNAFQSLEMIPQQFKTAGGGAPGGGGYPGFMPGTNAPNVPVTSVGPEEALFATA